MKILFLDQVGGASGDMFLGLLVGLGVDPAKMAEALARLKAGEIRIEANSVERAGLAATHVKVATPMTAHDHGHGDHHDHHDHHDHGDHPHHEHRGYSDIVQLIRESGLPERVIERSIGVFTRLGAAEARVHGIPLEKVHFHEVGALDSIADIVGTCWGLHELGVERIVSSPFVLGRGTIRMAHGVWPLPAPATALLIEGFPARHVAIDGETVTPTGAALVVSLADSVGGECPMTIVKSAAGAGSKEWPDRPNVLRGFLGESSTVSGTDEVVVLEAAIDDMTPEGVGFLTTALLRAGALDVMTSPVVMKKGRPGFHVTALSRPGMDEALSEIFFRESTTLGVRRRRESRIVLSRRIVTVETPWGPVGVKVSEMPDGTVRVSPEYEDCARIATTRSVPFPEVMETVTSLASKAIRSDAQGSGQNPRV